MHQTPDLTKVAQRISHNFSEHAQKESEREREERDDIQESEQVRHIDERRENKRRLSTWICGITNGVVPGGGGGRGDGGASLLLVDNPLVLLQLLAAHTVKRILKPARKSRQVVIGPIINL